MSQSEPAAVLEAEELRGLAAAGGRAVHRGGVRPVAEYGAGVGIYRHFAGSGHQAVDGRAPDSIPEMDQRCDRIII